jgi:hypothetical protein
MLIFSPGRRAYIIISLGVLLIGGLAGCSANPLAGMHRDGVESNATVLVADGQAALQRGDYPNAKNYFRLAIEHDYYNTEARLGYAEAALKARQFDLAAFINTLTSGSQQSGSVTTPPVLVLPQDWGCQSYSEVVDFFSEMVFVLDPVAQGQTHGSTAATNPTLNLNVGLFYLLRAAAEAQIISTSFVVEKLSKSSQTPAGLGIPQAVFDQLPGDFYWITHVPSPGQIAALQSDVDHGIVRMTTARDHSSSGTQKTLTDIIDLFQSLQVQVHL